MKNKKFLYKTFFVIFFFLILSHSLNSEENKSNIKIKTQKIETGKKRNQKVKQIKSAFNSGGSFESGGGEHVLILASLGLEKKVNSDARNLSQIFHHASKHEWNIINREIKSGQNDLSNFVSLIKFANCAKHGLAFNEEYIFNFLTNKHRGLNDSFIASKINKSSPNFLNQVNENNITQSGLNLLPSNLIARFRKNHALIRDPSFISSVKKVWHTKKFSSAQAEHQFLEIFKRVLGKADHDLRFENMIWSGNFEAAMRVYGKVSQQKKAQMQNRIKILRASSLAEVQGIINSLKKRGNSEEVQTAVFDAIRWCENRKLQSKKFEFLSYSSNFKNLNKHWGKLFKESRRELLSSGNQKFIQLAYHSSANHGEKPKTTDFVEAEFLAGFIAFNFLGDYQRAIDHFYRSFKNAENHNRISRGAYWIGLSLKKNGGRGRPFDSKQLNDPSYWFSVGSKNFTTFYGQLCAFEFDPGSNPVQRYLAQIDSQNLNNVRNHPLFSYYYYSLLTKNFDLASKIGKIFALSLRGKSEIVILAQLANILSMPLVSIHIGNVAKKHLNLTLIEALYPTPHYNNLKYNKALVYAIIHKESAFDHKVSGLAGEFGLMQIMPGTASKLSKQLGVHINHKNLYDPHLNTLLGSQYIKNLQGRFRGFSLLSIGAYNAGENVVERWIDSYGDPRNSRSHYDIVSWIESTSFKTTRYYMQTVMANYLIYQTILNSGHKNNLGRMLFY